MSSRKQEKLKHYMSPSWLMSKIINNNMLSPKANVAQCVVDESMNKTYRINPLHTSVVLNNN